MIYARCEFDFNSYLLGIFDSLNWQQSRATNLVLNLDKFDVSKEAQKLRERKRKNRKPGENGLEAVIGNR